MGQLSLICHWQVLSSASTIATLRPGWPLQLPYFVFLLAEGTGCLGGCFDRIIGHFGGMAIATIQRWGKDAKDRGRDRDITDSILSLTILHQ